MIYLQLFFSFLQVGLLALAEGMQRCPIDTGTDCYKACVLSMVEFTDLISISQMTPGPW